MPMNRRPCRTGFKREEPLLLLLPMKARRRYWLARWARLASCKWSNENAIKSTPLTSVDCRGALPHHNRTPARHSMQRLGQRIANKRSPSA